MAACDDLPHQADDPREPGRDREDDARAREAASRVRRAPALRGVTGGATRDVQRLPLLVERLRLELDQLAAIASRTDDRGRPLGRDPARSARCRASPRSRSTSACPAPGGGGHAPAAARAAAARRPPRGQHRERGCYHRPAREPRVFYRDAEHQATGEARPPGGAAAAGEPALALDREDAHAAPERGGRRRRRGRRPRRATASSSSGSTGPRRTALSTGTPSRGASLRRRSSPPARPREVSLLSPRASRAAA